MLSARQRHVDLEREYFIGQQAIREERKRGAAWDLVGLALSWEGLESLYAEVGIPPHLAPEACRLAVPVYDWNGRQVGQVTSSTWSPTVKRYLALAQVRRPHNELGTELFVEHTPMFERRKVSAEIVAKPFFDPPRKRDTPAALPRIEEE